MLIRLQMLSHQIGLVTVIPDLLLNLMIDRYLVIPDYNPLRWVADLAFVYIVPRVSSYLRYSVPCIGVCGLNAFKHLPTLRRHMVRYSKVPVHNLFV